MAQKSINSGMVYRKLLCSLIIPVLLICSFAGCSSPFSTKPDGKPENISYTENMVPIKNDVYLENENVSGLRETEVRERVMSLASKINVEVKDAKIDEEWVITQNEQMGRKVNVEATVKNLLDAKENTRVKLVLEEQKPKITAQMIKDNIVEIGSYSTPILDRGEGRIKNIKLASQKINYTIIRPGEEFSFNDTLGKRTKRKGYEEAPIIIKTEEGYEKGKGVGGGICQLSTTLFNAVDEGGMRITERNIHSKDVGYVPKGRDATVSYGVADFKFINSRKYPVMIKVYRTTSRLTVKIFENRNQL